MREKRCESMLEGVEHLSLCVRVCEEEQKLPQPIILTSTCLVAAPLITAATLLRRAPSVSSVVPAGYHYCIFVPLSAECVLVRRL